MTYTQSKFTTSLIAAIVITMAIAPAAFASISDFESFTANQSVNGQGQWTVEDSFGNTFPVGGYDEEVVDLSGNQVWRISNAITSTNYSSQPFSNKSEQVAGETGAGLYNDFGTDHTMPLNPPLSSATAASPNFYASWDFRSVTGAAQTGSSMQISAGASQSPLRQTYLAIVDSGSGFNLSFFDTTGSAFNNTIVATGLNYTDWHNVEMYIEFVDGIGPGASPNQAGNDIVSILVNGVLVHTGTTWESFYYNGTPSVRAVDSLLFRQPGTAVPGNDGGGLYFDNVEVSNASLNGVVPEPATLVVWSLLVGCAGTIAFRRMRNANDASA